MNRYLRREQLKDRWRGRRDGRRRTPSFSAQADLAESGQAISAPYPDQLLALAQQQIAGIREEFERTAAAGRTSLQTLRAQRQLAAKEVLKAAGEVTTAELPITEEELKPRNHTEAAFAGTDSLRGRRDELRRHRIGKAQAREIARIKAHDDIVARIAAVEEQIKTQFVTAQANAVAMSEHYATRISTYWEHNAHVHPEGTYFAPLLRFVAQQLPTWVTDPPAGDPLDLGRGRLEHRVVTRSLDVPAPPVHYHEADPDPDIDIDIEESA